MEQKSKTIAAVVASKLLQIKAIKLSPQNPFTWASGMKSPIYCDNRIILSYPEIRTFIIKQLVEKAKTFEPFDTIAGVATAGIAYGALLAEHLGLPFVYVRSKAKGHGRQNMIEGKITGKERILVIEDLISTGGSSLKAVEALRENGCDIAGLIAIFSYGFEKASDAFEKAKVPYTTLSEYDELLNEAIRTNYIASKDLETLQSWRKAPEEWNAG